MMNKEVKQAEEGALQALRELVDSGLEKEVIGEISIKQVLGAVDLSIAFSPVVVNSVGDYEFNVPIPVKLTKRDDGKYEATYKDETGKPVNFEILEPEVVKIMRARFLLLRDYYFRRLALDNMCHSMQQEVVSRYFDGHAYIPKSIIEKIKQEERAKHKKK